LNDPDLCAAFVIDADGNIVASNSSARQIWSPTGRSLVAMAFVTLFSRADASGAPEDPVEQWSQLKGGLDRWTPQVARRFDLPSCAVRVRLERSSGGGGSYIATVRPVVR